MRKGGSLLEITTYRSESYDPKSRKPDGRATATTLEDDLARRDFTVNAMARAPAVAASSSTRTAALTDLRASVLRTPGPPERVLRRRPAADAARRPVRRQLGFTVDAGGARRR